MDLLKEIKESLQNVWKTISVTERSKNWFSYHLGFAKSHCITCIDLNNKIVDNKALPPPLHIRCKCVLAPLKKVSVGMATERGTEGADYWLKHFGTLPNYYISKEEALTLGWISKKGNLNEVAYGKMIGGGIYKNFDERLPNASGRIWYECDIDYKGGYRNNFRIVYSNDGLMFRTDSHYLSFIAIE